MEKIKQNLFLYRMTQAAANVYSGFVFKRKIKRNEIKGKSGPFVVIANHQCAMDFVNLIGASSKPMVFVVSETFYRSIPVKGIMTKVGVIAKKQFETTIHDMRLMKQAVDAGQILVIYPAGLMCEDGLSTPIPEATFRFLKWLGADVYMAKTVGTYFVMPKWAKKTRRGRTYLDIYKLFDKEELRTISDAELISRSEEALLFDACREQDELKIKYKNADNIEGLENVLYACPHCGKELSMRVRDRKVIYCEVCGFAEEADEYGMLHKISEHGEEIRYVSDWSKKINLELEKKVRAGGIELSSHCKIRTINDEEHKFVESGEGTVTVADGHLSLKGFAEGKEIDFTMSVAYFPSLPFSPGRYVEIQHDDDIFRCFLDDGRQSQLFVNAIKAMHRIEVEARKK